MPGRFLITGLMCEERKGVKNITLFSLFECVIFKILKFIQPIKYGMEVMEA